MTAPKDRQDAFLAAIRDDPDDDAPRLVFADWLDDYGEPHRAELIRARCALADMRPKDPRREGPERREAELIAEFKAANEACGGPDGGGFVISADPAAG